MRVEPAAARSAGAARAVRAASTAVRNPGRPWSVFLLPSVGIVLVLVYASLSLFLHQQRSAAGLSPSRILPSHDPEIGLAAARREIAYGLDPEGLPGLVANINRSVPSYESPFLLAKHYATRKDAPEKVALGYEVAIRRYPTNGRLRLAFAQWLGIASEDFDAWKAVEGRFATSPSKLSEAQTLKALELEPSLLGTALEHLGNRFTAEAWMRIAPADGASREKLVAHFHANGDIASARRILESVVASSDDVAVIQRSVSWAETWGDDGWALSLAEQWLTAEGSDEAQLAATRFKIRLGRGREALAELRERVEILERQSAHSYRIAEILCRSGDVFARWKDVARAERLYGEALSRSPNQISCSLGLARVYEQSGDVGLASEEYRRVLHLEPLNADAASGLERVAGMSHR